MSCSTWLLILYPMSCDCSLPCLSPYCQIPSLCGFLVCFVCLLCFDLARGLFLLILVPLSFTKPFLLSHCELGNLGPFVFHKPLPFITLWTLKFWSLCLSQSPSFYHIVNREWQVPCTLHVGAGCRRGITRCLFCTVAPSAVSFSQGIHFQCNDGELSIYRRDYV